MRFGSFALEEAEGAILAHATDAGDRRLRKSHRLDSADIEALRVAGVTEVIAAQLDPGDVLEDEAALRVSAALSVAGVEARPPGTGRVNLHAEEDGLFTVDRTVIDTVNRIDPAITIATLPAHSRVRAGQMVATVKIIPFAVPAHTLAAVSLAAAGKRAFAVHAFAPRSVAVIQTTLPSLKQSVMDKTLQVTAARLARSASRVSGETRVPHRADASAEAIAEAAGGADMVVIFGASAMCDPRDVVPAAIRAAGGEVLAVGMPVDPGNLLVLGRFHGKPVLGAPGCARSAKENGFDWVLDRLMAGLDVTADDIAGMGVGGLLMEIPSRPQPREARVQERQPIVHAVVLAAGRSTRMGGRNKLLALFDGVPLVRRVAEIALASPASGVSVVTGHQQERVREALSGLTVELAHNPDHASGMASSLKAALAAVPPDAAGALVLLGDMPGVSVEHVSRLIDIFVQANGRAVVRATHDGKRGNPVILPRELFARTALIEGDTGARDIIEEGSVEVIDVELGVPAGLDVDTPEALARAGGVPGG